jgi:dUTP pyrophosphatase
MPKILFKKLHPNALIPQMMRPGDAGMDLSSIAEIAIQPGTREIVKTGVSLAIPDGHVGLFWDRSGLAAKHGIHILAGVLDSNYRGELMVVMLNTSNQVYEVKAGDRIVQLLIQPVANLPIEEVSELPESNRGEGRFGSSGR